MQVKAGTRLTYLFYGFGPAQRNSTSWNQFHYRKIIAEEFPPNVGPRPRTIYLTERLLLNRGESVRVYWDLQRKGAFSNIEYSDVRTGNKIHIKWSA